MCSAKVVFAAIVSASGILLAHGAEMAAPFGIRLGERISDPIPALTAENLDMFVLTNGFSCIADGARWPRWEGTEVVDLPRRLLGVTEVAVEVDQEGAGYEFIVRGSLRRGLAREESLGKIENLRKEVERECGFKLNVYSFSAPPTRILFGGRRRKLISPSVCLGGEQPAEPERRKLQPDTGFGKGAGLWTEIDCVQAESVTTHDGMRVSITCRVNAFSNGDDSKTADSPIGVTVGIMRVDVLRKAEDRAAAERQLLVDRKAAAESARIQEFLGVELGKPTNTPTNELTAASFGSRQAENGHETVHYWQKELKGSNGMAVPFVDKMHALYSLKTLRAVYIRGTGCVPQGVDSMEVVRRLDEFALALNKKYGLAIHRGPIPLGHNRNRRLDPIVSDYMDYSFQNEFVEVQIHFNIEKRKISLTISDVTVRQALNEEGREKVQKKDDSDKD